MKSKDARSFDIERDLIKERKRKWYVKVIVLAGIVVGALTCAVFSIPSINRDGLLRRIPETYTESEHLSPEDRELLNDIRTSFFPTSSIALPQGETDNIINTYANFLLNTLKLSQYKDADEDQYNLREKYQEERSELYFSEQYRDRIRRSSDSEWIRENLDLDSNETMAEEQLKWNDKIVEAKTSAERNPIDDVIDGVKRHPEQDENDLRLNLNHEIFADAQPFWDNQGDEDTIRRNQASFMLQHMDLTADPCEDFYRYACGNWAAVHPIPADKAGSDTFEMLRENLDAILRDLLSDESIEDIAPKVEKSFDGATNYLRVDAKENNEKRQMSSKVSFSEEVTPTVQDFTETTTVEYINKVTNNNGISNRKKRNDEDYVEIYINDDWLPQSLFRINNRKILARKTGHIIDYELRDFILKRDKKSADDIERIADEKDEPIHDKEDAITKAKNLYKSCMNYEILEQRGHEPLLALLNELGGWPLLDPNWNSTNFDWVELMARLRLYNNDILISEWVGPDIKNSDEFVIQFDQTTLGLPSRDYFLQPINSIYLEAYQTYLVKVATLLGSDVENAEKQAVEIIDFETKLAKITSAFEERRNFSEAYQRLSIEKLHELVPKLNWTKYISIVLNRSMNSDETVVIFALKYVQDLVDLIEKTEPKVVSNYLLWRFVRNRVNNLDDRFQDAKQIFYYILFGREQSPPRWKSCVSQVNSNMGMALGAMFVEKYFDETSKNETLIMTKEIQETFKELLNMTSWIDDETKSLASEKVNAMDLRIGYPNFISDKDELSKTFKDVNIDPDKYFENTLNILKHLTQVEQSRLGQLVNKTIWTTPPAVVNAYYSRNKNQIMFPAGILQPPFYHRHFPRSLNYGGIGVVIGHEITHGFDDKGRLFDRYGNLHKWWNDMAIEVFHKKAQCLIDQYGTYTMHEVAMPLNGLNTQGENIADNGGIKQAFRAYKHWLSENNDSDETLPGLNVTNTQLFFLNFAQIWCGAMRPEALKNKLKTAVHSPGRYRVIGTLSNSEDFAREYNCPPESPMNPSKKCNVW